LVNPDNNCYANAALQLLLATPEFRDIFLSPDMKSVVVADQSSLPASFPPPTPVDVKVPALDSTCFSLSMTDFPRFLAFPLLSCGSRLLESDYALGSRGSMVKELARFIRRITSGFLCPPAPCLLFPLLFCLSCPPFRSGLWTPLPSAFPVIQRGTLNRL